MNKMAVGLAVVIFSVCVRGATAGWVCDGIKDSDDTPWLRATDDAVAVHTGTTLASGAHPARALQVSYTGSLSTHIAASMMPSWSVLPPDGVTMTTNGVFANNIKVYEGNTNALTSISFDNLNGAQSVGLNGTSYTNIAAPELVWLGTGGIISSGPASLPRLQRLSFPKLEYADSGFMSLYLTAPLLTVLDVAKVRSITTSIGITANSLPALRLDSLQYCLGITAVGTNMGTVYAPGLVYAGTVVVTSPALTNLVLGAANVTKILDSVTVTNAALTIASVSNTLAMLASLDGTGGTTAWSGKTVNLSGGTSAGTSTWSSAMLGYRTTLTNRSNTVTVNP